jgi:hypothetical protein
MVVTKEKPYKYLPLDNFLPISEAPKISNPEVPKKQEGGKFTTVAQELGERLNDYVRFTSSSEGFKNDLKDKFGGNINQFNQNLVLSALTLAHMEKAAEKDEELKKSLPSLQEKMKAVNENIGKIAKELGYTVSQYSLDKLMGKDLNGVKETLEKDFGVKLKFEGLFSAETLNSLTDLFAFIVNKFYPGSVNATFATVPIISDTEDKEGNKQKSVAQQVVLQQQQAEQSVKQQPEEEHADYHSPLRGTGKKIGIVGGVLVILGGVLFAGSSVYLPMAALGLSGVGLVALGFPLVFVGGVAWVAGVISEAIHNHRVPKAPDEKEEEREKKKRKKEEGKEEKEEKDTQQKGGENNNTQQQEGKH